MKVLTFDRPIRFEVDEIVKYDAVWHLFGHLLNGEYTKERYLRAEPDPAWEQVRIIELPGTTLTEVQSASGQMGAGSHYRPIYTGKLYLAPAGSSMVRFVDVTILATKDQADDERAQAVLNQFTTEQAQKRRARYMLATEKRMSTMAAKKRRSELRAKHLPTLQQIWHRRAVSHGALIGVFTINACGEYQFEGKVWNEMIVFAWSHRALPPPVGKPVLFRQEFRLRSTRTVVVVSPVKLESYEYDSDYVGLE